MFTVLGSVNQADRNFIWKTDEAIVVMSLEVFIQFFIYSPYGPAYGCDNAMGESDRAIGQKDETIAQSDGKTGQERTKKEHSDLAIGKDDGRQNKAMRRQGKKQL